MLVKYIQLGKNDACQYNVISFKLTIKSEALDSCF